MKNKINLNNLINNPALADEWEYIVNTSRLSAYPRWQWGFRLRQKERSFPKERVESFLSGLASFAKQKETGEVVRLSLYSDEEVQTDVTKRHAVLYLRLQSKPSPLALIAPGGAYAHISVINEGFPIAERLFERGYSTAVLLYRVAEDSGDTRPLEDLSRAFSLLRDYGVAALWGFSAGGHLCSCYCGLAKARGYTLPQSLVLGYPVISFDDGLTHRYSRSCFFGHEPTEFEKREYSSENLVTESFPPTYLWHCENDETVSVENSRLFASKLKDAGVAHKLRIFPNGSHGLGAAAGLPEAVWLDEAIDFCDKFNK